MVTREELSNWLQTTVIFGSLSSSQITKIASIAQLQSFSKGEIIFKQGSEASGLFLVKTGRVKVFKVSIDGKEQILNIFEAGDNFAEVAALDGKPFPASAATLEPAKVVFFPRLAFLNLLHQDPDISINMLISLSQHSRHLAKIIEELSFKDVPQRLASYLLNLSDSCPQKQADGTIFVTLDLTKSQLAAILGTIPATLSRAFYRLSSQGLIAVKGSQIELLDREDLQKFIKM